MFYLVAVLNLSLLALSVELEYMLKVSMGQHFQGPSVVWRTRRHIKLGEF